MLRGIQPALTTGVAVKSVRLVARPDNGADGKGQGPHVRNVRGVGGQAVLQAVTA